MKTLLAWALGPTLLVSASCAAPGVGSGGPATAEAPPSEGAAPPPAAETPAAAATPISVYSGVYTSAQASRGDAIQRRACSACHTPSDWAEGRLLSGWTGRSAYDLVSHVRNTMPLNAPGSLSWQEYTDILAFMLELNSIPSGESELDPAEGQLRRIEIEYRR